MEIKYVVLYLRIVVEAQLRRWYIRDNMNKIQFYKRNGAVSF